MTENNPNQSQNPTERPAHWRKVRTIVSKGVQHAAMKHDLTPSEGVLRAICTHARIRDEWRQNEEMPLLADDIIPIPCFPFMPLSFHLMKLSPQSDN